MNNFPEKLMGFNEAMKIRKCNIHGPEKRHIFIGISWDFYEPAVGSEAVPLFVIVPAGQMCLKGQNEQEVQSQLVRYRWSVTKTKTPSVRKG